MRQRSVVKRKDTASGEPLYHPSIFRYKCRGRLQLSSKDIGSPGVCQGLKSQLEHVDHWRLVTRDEAVRVFSQQASGSIGEAPSQPASEDATAAALETALLSQVLIYPNITAATATTRKDETDKKTPLPRPSSGLPEEELITSQDWSCYGSTELDLLVLRPQGETEEKIVAVSPYCSPGLSLRDVRSELGNDRTSTLRLGFVEVVVQSAAPPDEDENVEMEDVTNANEHKPSPSMSKNETSDRSEPKNNPRTDDGKTKKSALPTLEKAYGMSSKILQHMKANAIIVKDAVKDDFPNRTYAAGSRIVGELGNTFDKTLQLMGKVSKALFGGDSDKPDDKGRR